MTAAQIQVLRDLTDNGGSVGQYFIKKLKPQWSDQPTKFQRNDK
jgi:hypothetical protein